MIGNAVECPAEIEKFEIVKLGHRVIFKPRDAVGGGQGLRKAITGRVTNLDDGSGMAQVGQWMVPYKKVRRLDADAYKEYSSAARKCERQEVYGGLKPAQKKALTACAKNARAASLYTCMGSYSGPITKSVNAEMKRCREKFMGRHGIKDTTDRGQCAALPLFLERALKAGKVPALRDIEYRSAETGNIGIGDTVSIGGHPFKLAGYTPEGNVTLKDGYEIVVPPEYVPLDAGSAILVLKKPKIKKRRQRWFERSKHRRQIKKSRLKRTYKFLTIKHGLRRSRKYCFGRDRRGRFTRLPKRGRILKRSEKNPNNGTSWLKKGALIAGGVVLLAALIRRVPQSTERIITVN